ncbi:hypothetical protein GKQ38_01620 [Candidatus Nanohaloarchaea archaeon]|nr:hypothetical protein GKQ38_01620 [Candidatus Nanohaloarchaea archaeon]
MKAEEIETRIDEVGNEWRGLYSLFEDKGDKAVDILYHADPEDYNLPLPGEVYQEVDEDGLLPSGIPEGDFESIVNFLSRAEILPTWNDSAPFRILMNDIDEQDLATAYEYVSGEQYNFPEDGLVAERNVDVPDYLSS